MFLNGFADDGGIAKIKTADFCTIHDLLPHDKGKGGTLAVGALYVQVGSHELQHAGADREPQPRTLNAAGADDIQPVKRRKEPADFFLLYADACIPHHHLQLHILAIFLSRLHPQGYGTLFRVLCGIGKQVGDNLLETQLVPEESNRQMGVDFQQEEQSLFLQAEFHKIGQICNEGAGIVLCLDEFHAACLDLGEIQDVIDDAQEAGARCANVVGILQDVLVMTLPAYQLIHAQNGGDGGAYLMAHVGEEVCLGPVGLFRRLESLTQSLALLQELFLQCDFFLQFLLLDASLCFR